MNKLKIIIRQYREQLLYLISGASTTLINILTYGLATRLWHIEIMLANVIAWIVAVSVAYLLNKFLVFRSKSNSISALTKEIFSFFSARVVTLLLETTLLWIGIHVLHLPDLLVKVFSNVVVIVSNYILAKIFVFK